MRIGEICDYLRQQGMSADCPAPVRERALSGVAPLEKAAPEQLSFVAQSAYLPRLETTRAGAVLIRPEWREHVPDDVAALEVEDPYAAYALIAQHWYGGKSPTARRIDASARIDPQARLAQSVVVDAHAVIEAGAAIEEGCRIGAGCFVGSEAQLGKNVTLEPGVVIYARCVVGDDTRIKAGAVIGSDGFGFAPWRGRWIPIPQLGRVVIGRRCSIGANATIDRGALDDTVIEDDVILDNLVHIAHNVHVGQGTAMAAQVGVAGSARIGRHCQFGGQAGMPGHLKMGDRVIMMARGAPGGDIETAGVYAGFPAIPHKLWKKSRIYLRKLPELARELRELRRRVEALSVQRNIDKKDKDHD